MRRFSTSLLALLLPVLVSHAQQPTTTAPLVGVNSRYVQGIGPGYYPTAGSGLTLNVAAGTSFCDGAIVTYAAGTLSLTNTATNRVYLDTNCTVSFKTTAFVVGDIPIATVVTSGGAISSITDQRTWFVEPSAGGVTNVTASSPIFSTGGATPNITCPTCSNFPGSNIQGGFLGGYKSSSANGVPYAQTAGAFNIEFSFPETGYLKNIGICVPADNDAAGAERQGITWNMGNPVGTSNLTWGTSVAIMASGQAALPCAQNTIDFQAIRRDALVGVSMNQATGSTAPTGWSAQFFGATGQPMGVGLGGSAVAGSTTNITSVGMYATLVAAASEAIVQVPVPYAGTLSRLCAVMGGAQGAGGSIVFTARDTGVDTSVVATVPANSQVIGAYCDTVNTHAYAAGDLISIKVVNNSASTSGGIASLSWFYTPSSDGRAWIVWPYGNTAAVTASTTQYITAWARVGNATTTEANWRTPIPLGGTMQDLSCYITNTPTNNVTVAPTESAAISSGLTLTMTGGVSTGLINGTGSEVYEQGDSMNLSIVTGAGTQPLISACSAAFIF